VGGCLPVPTGDRNPGERSIGEGHIPGAIPGGVSPAGGVWCNLAVSRSRTSPVVLVGVIPDCWWFATAASLARMSVVGSRDIRVEPHLALHLVCLGL